MLRRWPGCTNRLINGCGVGVQIFLSPAFFSILHLPATIDSMKESYLAVANKAACCCIQRQHKRAATDLYTRSYRGWSQCTLLLKDLRRVTDTLWAASWINLLLLFSVTQTSFVTFLFTLLAIEDLVFLSWVLILPLETLSINTILKQ